MSYKNQPVTKKKIRWLSLCLAAVIMLAALPLHPMPARGDTATGNITVGVMPFAIAVNPVTNKIYVANSGSNTVTVIDGADNSTATVAAGSYPYAVAVNPATNKIYVANENSDNVTVIDGINNSTTDVVVGTKPRAVAVNPATNKIYVANFYSKTVTVIDGADNSTTTVDAGTGPCAVAVNPATNKIYVTNRASDTVTVIDGTDNSTATVAAGDVPHAVAVNPASNKIYVANASSNSVTVIEEQAVQEIDPVVTISPLPGHVTTNPSPDFSFSSTTNNPLPVQQIWHQLDTMTGAWQKALPGGGSASVTLPPLAPGTHVLYAMATDGQDSTSINTGFGSSPVTGKIAAYAFTVILSGENNILAFTLPQQTGAAVIDSVAHTVYSEVSYGTSLASLTPTITVSEGATISPLSGEAQDFTNPVTYTVTAQNGSAQDWTVTCIAMPSSGGSSGDSNGGSSGGNSTATSSGMRVTSSGRTFSQNGVTLTFPAGTVESDINVTIRQVSQSSGLNIPEGSQLLSRIMNIIKNKSGNFLKPVTITLSFNNAGLDPDEYDISIYYYDEDTGKWIALDNIRLNLDTNTISGDTTHFTKFAVIATPKTKKPSKPVTPQPTVNIPGDISGHWAKDSIMKMINAGVISSYPDRTFKPDKAVTRAEFTVMLVKALNLETKAGKIFTDTASHWAKDSISTAATHGIINGYDEKTFGPDDLITREQAAVIIARAAKLEAATNELNFTDSKAISPWAKPGVAAAVKAGFITGYPDNSFRPQGHTTRAEAAVMIGKLL